MSERKLDRLTKRGGFGCCFAFFRRVVVPFLAPPVDPCVVAKFDVAVDCLVGRLGRLAVVSEDWFVFSESQPDCQASSVCVIDAQSIFVPGWSRRYFAAACESASLFVSERHWRR